MDQEIIVTSIGEHLDTIESYLNWAILFAVAAAWGGVHREPEIEVLGTKVNRRHAFFAAAVLFLVANMAVFILFLRIGSLLELLAPNYRIQGITALATDTWVLNPFSFFGTSAVARFHSGEGFGLLIVVWWLCNTALSTLMDDKSNWRARFLLILFLGLGLASMLSIQRVYGISLNLLEEIDPQFYAAASRTISERIIGSYLGILVGGLIFVGANTWQVRQQANRTSTRETGDYEGEAERLFRP